MADASNPFTILKSFDHDLPQVRRAPDSKYAFLRHGGPATELPACPQILICDKVKPLLDAAEQALRHDNVKSQPRLNCRVLSESFQVCGIIGIFYPKGWEYSNQVTPSKLVEDQDKTIDRGNTTISGAEHTQHNVVFYAKDNEGNQGKTTAIIEMKKPNMIKYSDYEKALVANATASAGTAAASSNSTDTSLLMYNAKAYTAQLSDTARKHKCPHAAILNWDNLLLHHFDVDSEDASCTGGNQAGFIWAHEAGEGGAFMEKCHLRKAMSGWLLCAFQDHFGPSSAM